MDESIIAFLIRAKRATYAANGVRVAAPLRPNSRDYQYAEGPLTYIDSFLGGVKFAGEEALFRDRQPLWAMNYLGRALSGDFSSDFLKEALLRASVDSPFRGPPEYHNDAYTYKCSVKGNFHWFYGYEEIYFQGEKVYECAFHGGDIE